MVSVTTDLPQGPPVGPLAFVVFISDMPLEQPLFAHKYMDDTTLSESFKSKEESHLQSTTDKVVQWSDSNKIKVNVKKTKEMTISFKRTPLEIQPVTIKGTPLEQVKFFKLLGVWIADDLTWHLAFTTCGN